MSQDETSALHRLDVFFEITSLVEAILRHDCGENCEQRRCLAEDLVEILRVKATSFNERSSSTSQSASISLVATVDSLLVALRCCSGSSDNPALQLLPSVLQKLVESLGDETELLCRESTTQFNSRPARSSPPDALKQRLMHKGPTKSAISEKTPASYLQKSCYIQQQMQQVDADLPLYVSSFHPAADSAVLDAAGITHIVVCIDVKPRFPDRYRYLILPLSDTPDFNITPYFEAAFNFIQNAFDENLSPSSSLSGCSSKCNKVLVHCGAGISRAPSIAASYLIRAKKMSAADAVRQIQAVRSCARPNKGFMQQLRELEKCCH